jgi:hypothetical protein
MALAEPSLGQPLDVAFIGTLVKSINAVDAKITSTNTAATSKVGTSPARIATSLAFAAETKTGVNIKASIGANSVAASGTWDYQGISYAAKPIVTGTITSNPANTESNRSLILNITDIRTSGISFEIISVAGTLTTPFNIEVSFIAIGYTS